MKTSVYIFFFFLIMQVLPSQAQTSVYQGMVNIKQNKIELEKGVLLLDMNVSLCGLSVARHQSLLLTPVLRNGSNSLRLQPIRVNGANKQKMYKRAVAFQGKVTADGNAYVILESDPALLQEIAYKKEVPFKPWMEHAELILVGELNNYDDIPVQTYTDVLTDDLNIRPAKGK
ncbi:DUF3868 domain-containing protein [uncultured Parabacteroides sp.]|uniref:DUF3868 domain-containing protein n=1 Tax=uncultured Parabacteroides sp. TaxID=512312 RepID=UPI0025F1CA9B|nr:DUF3868 domain-containing protein [uncultured Parabacteroides sp.]